MPSGETVVVLTAGGTTTDRYSNEVPDWSVPPVETPWENVLAEPRPSGEPMQDARNQVVTGWTLYSRTVPAVIPTAANRVRVRGVVFEVDGDAADWQFGGKRGLVVQAVRKAG